MRENLSIIGISLMVLISTYWNVNFDFDVQITQIQHVLISTYWNVN